MPRSVSSPRDLLTRIGSPLQVLNGRAGRLANRRDLPADAQRDAEILVQQTDRIAGIVGQLLTFARRKAPRFEEINMVDVTGAVIDLLGYEVKHRAVKLDFNHDAALSRIVADSGQIQQVIFNL